MTAILIVSNRGLILCLGVHPVRDRLEVSRQTNFGHQPKYPESGIKLPFPETLTNRSGKEVMVVVPTFSKCNQGDPCIVAAIVAGLESFLSKHVSDRVDRESGMVENYRRYQESPGQPLPTRRLKVGCRPLRFTEQIATAGQRDDWYPVELVDETQFRKLQPVGNFLQVGGQGVFSHKPVDVTPEKTLALRGMHVVVGVRVAMMHAMVSGPPKRSPLTRATGCEGTQELNYS